MPEMDGYTLCREIKRTEELKNIPVVLLTSLSDIRDIMKGLECGADDFNHSESGVIFPLSIIHSTGPRCSSTVS